MGLPRRRRKPTVEPADEPPTVTYRRPQCPHCGARKGLRNNGRQDGGAKTYFRCGSCGKTFVAVEI